MQRKKATEEKAAASAESSGASGKRQSSRTIVVSKAMRVVSSEARLAPPELISSQHFHSQHALLHCFTSLLLQHSGILCICHSCFILHLDAILDKMIEIGNISIPYYI